jgi:UPF0271 protein
MSGQSIDLNSDVGEGFGAYEMGDDAGMLESITSANVACGFHAGDPGIMADLFATARARGIAVGAHPGFPDLWGFGRRVMPFKPKEIERLIAYQVGAAQAMATYAGHRVSYVKTHGALGNVTETDREVAEAVVRAVKAVDASLVLLGIGLSAQIAAGDAAGLRTVSEIYADRGYTDEGRLVPRGQPGALITDPDAAAARVLAMIQAGGVVTTGGRTIPFAVGSVCVHSDTPNAAAIGRRVRETLEQAGIRVAAFTPVG